MHTYAYPMASTKSHGAAMDEIDLSDAPYALRRVFELARINHVSMFIHHYDDHAPRWARILVKRLDAFESVKGWYVDELFYEPAGVISKLGGDLVCEHNCHYWKVADGGRLVAWMRPR